MPPPLSSRTHRSPGAKNFARFVKGDNVGVVGYTSKPFRIVAEQEQAAGVGLDVNDAEEIAPAQRAGGKLADIVYI